MLKIKVIFIFNFDCLINVCHSQALELQRNLENVGGEKLKSQKSKVQKIQSVSILYIKNLLLYLILGIVDVLMVPLLLGY